MPVRRGMTPEQVAGLLGPPTDRMTYEDLVGSIPGTVVRMRVRGQPPPRPRVYWVYRDVPAAGSSLMVEFVGGRAATVDSREDGRVPAPDAPPRHGWAGPLMERHLARAAEEHPDPRLTARPGFGTLGSPEVMRFVLTVDDPVAGTGPMSVQARRFDDVDVFATVLPVADNERIRALLPAGYKPFLVTTLENFGLGTLGRDVAHWILGRDDDSGRTVVHLAYLAAAEGVRILLPWDILSDAERSRRRR